MRLREHSAPGPEPGIGPGIEDPDVAIYRMFRMPRLKQSLQERALHLHAPRHWDDPFEDLLVRCIAVWPRSNRQLLFDGRRRPTYASSWSLTEESDPLWRAYSDVRKDRSTWRNTADPEREGVQVRSTPRKLARALKAWRPIGAADSCFLAAVMYRPSSDAIVQHFANVIGTEGREAFATGPGCAESVLYKRAAFAHEAEVRLIYVAPEGAPELEGIALPIDPNDLFDEVVFDPRLDEAECAEREADIRALGYDGPLRGSPLYDRGRLYEILAEDH